MLKKVLAPAVTQTLSRIDDHDIILLERIFNQINTYSVVRWMVALYGLQDVKADDQTVYVFNNGKSLSYLYRVNAATKTIKIDAVPFGDMVWDDPIFFLDALAETQKISTGLPKGLLERLPQFEGNFKTEVTVHFSLNCSQKMGLEGLITGNGHSVEARQKLLELAEPYPKSLSKAFFKKVKFKRYARAVHGILPLAQKLKMTFGELTEKLMFFTHAGDRLQIFTHAELKHILDQVPGVELKVPANHDLKTETPASLNRFYSQKFEEIKNSLQNFENTNLVIEDEQGIYHLVYASGLGAHMQKEGFEVMTFPVSFGTDFKSFYLQWLNMAKSRGLVSLDAKKEFNLETLAEFAAQIKNQKIFFSIINLHYLDQMDQEEAQKFFNALNEAFKGAPQSRLLTTSVPAIPESIKDPQALIYKLGALNGERDWKHIEQFVIEDLKKINPVLTLDLNKKVIERLWQMSGQNTFLLAALIRDLVTTFKTPLFKKRVLTAEMVNDYFVNEKEYKLSQKFFKHFGDHDYRRLFYAATMSYLLDIPVNHFVVGMQIENHRTLKWVYQDGSFGWTRFSPELHHESLEDLFSDIKKLYFRYAAYPEQGGQRVENRYVLLNHELTPPPEDISKFQIGIGLLKMHLQQHPYLLKSGFTWEHFLREVVRKHYKRDDVADLLEQAIKRFPEVLNDLKFLIQFNVQSFNDETYETLLSRFPQSDRAQLEKSLESMLTVIGRSGHFVPPAQVMQHLLGQKEINLSSYQAEQDLNLSQIKMLHENLRSTHTISSKKIWKRLYNVVRKSPNYFKYNESVNDLLHLYEGIQDDRRMLQTLSQKFNGLLANIHHPSTYKVLLKSLKEALSLLKEIRSEYTARFSMSFTSPLSRLESALTEYLMNIEYLTNSLKDRKDLELSVVWKKLAEETTQLKIGIDSELKNNGIKSIQPVKIRDAIQGILTVSASVGSLYLAGSKAHDFYKDWDKDKIENQTKLKESINDQINEYFNYHKELSFDEKCSLAKDCVLRLGRLSIAEQMLKNPADTVPHKQILLQQQTLLKVLSHMQKNSTQNDFFDQVLKISEYQSAINIYFKEKQVAVSDLSQKIELRLQNIDQQLKTLTSGQLQPLPQPAK